MQFNSDTNLDDIISDITEITKMDLEEYPIEERTRNSNHWYFRAIQDIIKVVRENVFFDTSFAGSSDNGWTIDTNEGSATHDLVNGDRAIQLPTTNKPWIIYRVAYMRDGVSYHTSNPFHVAQLGGNQVNDSELDSQIAFDSPMHRFNGDKILPYPIANQDVPDGIKIWYLPQPVKFTVDDTTKVPEINEAFHKIISLGASYEKLRGKPKGETILRDLTGLRQELRDFYASFLVDSEIISKVDPGNYA